MTPIMNSCNTNCYSFYNVTTGVATVPPGASGLYYISAQAELSDAGSFELRISGSVVKTHVIASAGMGIISTVQSLQPGHTIQFMVNITSGGTIDSGTLAIVKAQ